MAKAQLYLGSSGNDVKDLQKILNQKGYGLSEDGIFGQNTLKAVADYQRKNGLDDDGIVEEKTWGSLMGTSSVGNAMIQGAQAVANAVKWQSQLDDTIKKILNREKFSYDLNGDALYQQYKDKFIKQGEMAMGDAIGRASAMTGGYGNSYAQSVGQQAYQAQLENLNDVVPELYQMAYDKYKQEGQDLYNQYAMLGDRENMDYDRYRDSIKANSSSGGSKKPDYVDPWANEEEGKIDIEADLNYFISKGADKSEINNYLREALKNGLITNSQYQTFKNKYAPRGYTY